MKRKNLYNYYVDYNGVMTIYYGTHCSIATIENCGSMSSYDKKILMETVIKEMGLTL